MNAAMETPNAGLPIQLSSARQQRITPRRRRLCRLSGAALAVAALSLFGTSRLSAQAILTVTPGDTAATVAGTGSAGYSGDHGPASAATFASPSAVAYDGSGNLYVADRDNNVVRMISASGTVTTVAGTGQQGFSGDGGAATSALLDAPTGIALDAAGNLYIADSHNQRIREVSGGVITTIAGNGTAGFSGDGGAATSAALSLPTAVAVDSHGNIFIADTNNQRIREVSGGVITTIAGDGNQGYSGDGGAASAASLDSPSGVAVDTAGNVYIADRHNQRIREVNTAGKISTVAGSGSVDFAGGYFGDGGSPTAATLSRPSGVAIDAAGNLYIADSGNQRLREVGNGAIASIAGNGMQGYAGDGGAATAALLNGPRGAAVDAAGNVVVADRLNERVRGANLPELIFPSQPVGVASTAQFVTLTNSGTGTLIVQSANFTGSFRSASGGTCSALPISLSAGASCTEAIVFFPASAGSFSGNVLFSGSGVVPQTILLSGTATGSGPVLSLTSSANPSVFGSSVTFIASMPAGSTPVPTGTVTFEDGSTALATVQLSGGSASYSTSALHAGTHAITAVYSGDTSWQPVTSAVLNQVVNKATPVIQWATPAAIAYGTPLSGTQLNATSTVAGVFTYTPVAGTVLTPGTHTLSVQLIPSDTTDYNTGTGSVSLTVTTAPASIALTASPNPAFVKNTVTLTATVSSSLATPTGTVSFFDGTTLLGSVPLSAGTAALNASTLAVGPHSITAAYNGDANFSSVTSAPATETIEDFSIAVANGSPSAMTIHSGETAVFQLTASPIGGTTLPASVKISAAGLPTDSYATVIPPVVPAGTGTTPLIVAITTGSQNAALSPLIQRGAPPAFLCIVLLPFARRLRQAKKRLVRVLPVVALLLTVAGVMTSLTGCGSSSGHTPTGNYTITVTGTSGSLSHSATVTLQVK